MLVGEPPAVLTGASWRTQRARPMLAAEEFWANAQVRKYCGPLPLGLIRDSHAATVFACRMLRETIHARTSGETDPAGRTYLTFGWFGHTPYLSR